MTPELLINMLIVKVEAMGAHTRATDCAFVMKVRTSVGESLTIGLSAEALAEFCTALLDSSPRTPGTPGRN